MLVQLVFVSNITDRISAISRVRYFSKNLALSPNTLEGTAKIFTKLNYPKGLILRDTTFLPTVLYLLNIKCINRLINVVLKYSITEYNTVCQVIPYNLKLASLKTLSIVSTGNPFLSLIIANDSCPPISTTNPLS